MPINIDDNDFPASYDSTLNLVQVTKSLAHLIKKITGKNAWTDYPTKNIAELKASIDNINSINRPRILWKTPRAQSHDVGITATTLYTITIPAGTCSIDSILNLHMKFQAFNTTSSKTFSVVCNGITLSQFSLAQNTWYPYWKQISFNGSLSQPRTNGIAMGGFTSATTTSVNSFADFSLDQTLTIRCSATTPETAIFVESGYLELI